MAELEQRLPDTPSFSQQPPFPREKAAFAAPPSLPPILLPPAKAAGLILFIPVLNKKFGSGPLENVEGGASEGLFSPQPGSGIRSRSHHVLPRLCSNSPPELMGRAEGGGTPELICS